MKIGVIGSKMYVPVKLESPLQLIIFATGRTYRLLVTMHMD
jgi:hypothetical protein